MIVLFPLVFVVGGVDFIGENLAELHAVFLQLFQVLQERRKKIVVVKIAHRGHFDDFALLEYALVDIIPNYVAFYEVEKVLFV